VELENARLKDERPSVQPAPPEPPSHFEPPVGDLGTAAPPLNDFPSNEAAASNVCPDGYDYGGRYGGYQATRFNSLLLDDCKCDARAAYNHHASRRFPSVPGYVGSYSAPFTDPNAYGHLLCVQWRAPGREPSATGARPDAAHFGEHRACHECLLPLYPVVYRSG
jgi:hypothetical protein